MELDESRLEIVPVRLEHAAEVEGCTHYCTHVSATLDKGEPIAIYPVRFVNASKRAGINAALCRECYMRLPRENQISKN
jgi:hypothetical protein